MKVDLDIDSALATSGVDVYVLNDTWDLHGAYKLAMKNYYNAMKEEMEIGKGQVGRWMDFKIFAGPTSDLAYPVIQNNSLNDERRDAGEHQYSQVKDSGSAVTRQFSLVPNTTASDWSIIAEWQNADRVDDDPTNVASGTPYADLTDSLDDANRDLLQSQYNEPPYAIIADQSMWRKVCTLQVGAAGNMKLSSGFFDAPLGIVLLDGFSASAPSTPGVTIHFQSGDYKGVKAPPYATPMLTEGKEYMVI